MVRQNRQVETRMIAEYLVAQYSKFPYMTNVPLGTSSVSLQQQFGTDKALGLSYPNRWKADAIVILPKYLIVIEAKVWQVLMGLGKLPIYKDLIPITPELQQYQPRDILMELVVAQSNPNLEVAARGRGVTIKEYNPDWLKAIIADMNKYWTSEYRTTRADKMALREEFGLQ